MTQPRVVVPGDIVMSTARTIARFYLMRPDRAMNSAAQYVVAHYAVKHGVILHAACLLSTHLHLVFEDVRGVSPDFLRDVHRGIANVVKAHRGWRGDVFSKHPSVVRLRTASAVIDKIAYVHANPVAAGAVRYAKDWPGFRSTPRDLGAAATTVPRTSLYYRENGSMPEEARLRFELPRLLVDLLGERGALEAITVATNRHEQEARAQVTGSGRRFVGAERCMRLSPFKRARTHETFGKLNPTFATKGGGRSGLARAAQELRDFRVRYREALAEWRRGRRTVEFPRGTWGMRVWHNALCDPAPA